ncbi:MAG: NfeD family protein [Prosthecobacter sp.]|jgi:membrane-bound serine protease (ClpP class)|nr:NfeD family protein [Prosthecobacter sp.]
MITTIAILAFFGVLLVILETFVPGGIAGFFGVAFILVAVAAAMWADELAHWSHLERVSLAGAVLLLSSAVCLIWLRFFAVRFFHRAFTLEEKSAPPSPPPPCVLGEEGTAISELRPLGRAEFSGRRFEVRCLDGFAPAGSRVCVAGHEPGNLIVRMLT